MENLLDIGNKLKRKKLELAANDLREFIGKNRDMIPHQIELTKAMNKVGDDPIKRMKVIKERLVKLNEVMKGLINGIKDK